MRKVKRDGTLWRSTYPTDYRTIHLKKSIWLELEIIGDFGHIGNQEKINQLIRFFKKHKIEKELNKKC